MTRFIEPVTLQGRVATLEPLTREHTPGLAKAAEDGDLWRLWYTSIAPPDKMDDYVAAALDMRQHQEAMPFVVRDNATGDIVGCTRFFNVDAKNRRGEGGGTRSALRGPSPRERGEGWGEGDVREFIASSLGDRRLPGRHAGGAALRGRGAGHSAARTTVRTAARGAGHAVVRLFAKAREQRRAKDL